MKKMADKEKKEKFVTPTFRVSYPHIFKAEAMKDKKGKEKGDRKFSVTALVPKTADMTKFKKAILKAKIDKWGSDKSKWPAITDAPVVDCDSPKFADKEGYKGHYKVMFSSQEAYRPEVLDVNGEVILDQAEVYPGCYARAVVSAFAWEFADKAGVSFAFDGIQKVRDGKPLGNRGAAKLAFEAEPLEESDEDDESFDDDDREESLEEIPF